MIGRWRRRRAERKHRQTLRRIDELLRSCDNIASGIEIEDPSLSLARLQPASITVSDKGSITVDMQPRSHGYTQIWGAPPMTAAYPMSSMPAYPMTSMPWPGMDKDAEIRKLRILLARERSRA